MSLIPINCVEYNEIRKQNVAKENGKEYRLINNKGYKVRKVRCDGCIAQNAGEKRCDYLMNVDEKESRRVFFIELKGGDLNQALKQLNNTVEYLKDEFLGFEKAARIIGSRDVPGFINLPEYVKLAKKITPKAIRRSTNGFLEESV